MPNLCVPFDRRWPAIVLGDLELMPNGRDDICRDTLYTAAIWQVIWERVAADRANVEQHFSKRLYNIGCGAGFARRKFFSLEDEQNLFVWPCSKPHKGAGATKWPKDTELMSTAVQMLARVENVPETSIQLEGDHIAFMIRCVMIAREWRKNVLPCNPIVRRGFGDSELRCQVAVNMAIGFTKMHDEAKFVVAWINHRNEHCYAALRATINLDRRLSSESGKRLLSCLIDFIVSRRGLPTQ